MNPVFLTEAPLPSRSCRTQSYSGYHGAEVALFEPRNLGELKSLLGFFREKQLSFSMLGGGISFDAHCIHPAISVSLTHFNAIDIDPKLNLLTVGGGARWKSIFKQAVACGYMPYCLPTSGEATPGGTISNDTYSRMTVYLLSLAFEGMSLRPREKVDQLFTQVFRICYEQYGGAVHLTKNLVLEDEVLLKMYGTALKKLKALKASYDPDGLLENELVARLFRLIEVENE